MNVTKHTENTLASSDSENAAAPAKASKESTSTQNQAKNHVGPTSSSSSSIVKPRTTPPEKDKPVGELIGEPFPSFDHQATVVDPFTQEMGRDATFEQELGTMLLDLILETHAWSSARPRHESQMAVQKLEQKITDVLEVEKEQGMFESSIMASSADGRRPKLLRSRSSLSECLSSKSSRSIMSTLIEKTRNNLNEFVNRMKTALAALI
ncbi:hypothetical protein PQX77_011963 [Marasmius sp. AFHP31]|nr:hypothetical protein PQX77_011963 [Marasmius sp. AFHP31]